MRYLTKFTTNNGKPDATGSRSAIFELYDPFTVTLAHPCANDSFNANQLTPRQYAYVGIGLNIAAISYNHVISSCAKSKLVEVYTGTAWTSDVSNSAFDNIFKGQNQLNNDDALKVYPHTTFTAITDVKIRVTYTSTYSSAPTGKLINEFIVTVFPVS